MDSGTIPLAQENEKTRDERSSNWERDADVSRCGACNIEFSMLLRKHHCRGCGKIFCHNCSRWCILLPENFNYQTPQRLCLECMKELSNLDYSRKI